MDFSGGMQEQLCSFWLIKYTPLMKKISDLIYLFIPCWTLEQDDPSCRLIDPFMYAVGPKTERNLVPFASPKASISDWWSLLLAWWLGVTSTGNVIHVGLHLLRVILVFSVDFNILFSYFYFLGELILVMFSDVWKQNWYGIEDKDQKEKGNIYVCMIRRRNNGNWWVGVFTV